MLDSFRVKRERGKNPSKDFRAQVSARKPISRIEVEASTFRPLRVVGVRDNDDGIDVQVFKNMNTIRAAKEAGLNGGTYVAANDQIKPDGRLMVYKINEKIDTIGLRHPLKQA